MPTNLAVLTALVASACVGGTPTGSSTPPVRVSCVAPDPQVCPVQWTPLQPDDRDCVARWTADLGNDGTPDRVWEETYDSSGRLAFERRSLPGVTESEWDYDSAGNVLEMRLDTGADGTLEILERYTYDVCGDLVEAYAEWAMNATCTRCRFRNTYTNGPCGEVTAEGDDGDDGTIDFRTTTTYTPTLVSIDTDEYLDGSIDRSFRLTYDEALGELEHYEFENDEGHAGPELVKDYVYDSESRYDVIIEEAVSPPSQTWSTHTYDADGRLVERITETTPGESMRETAIWDCP